MKLACAAVLAVLIAVAGGNAPVSAQSQTLTVAQLFNPEDMSPWNFTALATVDIWAHFMEPLTVFDRQGNLVGVVAESWQMVSPAEWVVKIRRGLRFHDPKYGELTADDVKFTLDRAVQQGEVLRRLLPKPVQEGSVEVVDKYTIRWKLGAPGTGSLPNYMSLLHMTSKAYVEGEGKETFKRRPMGTGPYRFVEFGDEPARRRARLFPGYWGAEARLRADRVAGAARRAHGEERPPGRRDRPLPVRPAGGRSRRSSGTRRRGSSRR